jgi:hypothetical protein
MRAQIIGKSCRNDYLKLIRCNRFGKITRYNNMYHDHLTNSYVIGITKLSIIGYKDHKNLMLTYIQLELDSYFPYVKSKIITIANKSQFHLEPHWVGAIVLRI